MIGLIQAVDWANRTNAHWVGLVLMAVLAIGVLVLPRRWAPLTLLAVACFIPAGQRLVVLTLDFSFLRIMTLLGWLRIVVRKETTGVRLQSLDLGLLGWAFVALTIYTLRRGTSEALIYKLGTTYDAIGLYFLLRCLVQDWRDLGRLGLTFSILAVPTFLAFCVERATGRNLFSVFGGVSEFTLVRDGRLRCQGAFGHPILAGTFWAAAWPLIAAGWWARKGGRAWSVIGSLCALTAIALTASSTPILAALVALLGGCSFLLRRFMRVGLVTALVSAVALHLVMNAPVWHLVARVSVIGGSTGWHRFYLIDETIRHFGEWWLLGTPSTEHWGRGLSDVTNQYVLEAVQGGVLGLLLFLGLLVLGFRAVGRVWRSAWPDPARVALAWALGVSLFAQCVSFVGVAYFDQTGILWFMVLACLASMDAARKKAGQPMRSRSDDRGESARRQGSRSVDANAPGLPGVLGS